jgi:hypothetical protein
VCAAFCYDHYDRGLTACDRQTVLCSPLQVISKSVSLSAYKVEPGVLYLTGGKVCNLMLQDSQFLAAADIDSEEAWQPLSEQTDASMPLPYNNNGAVMDLLYSDMAARIRFGANIGEQQERSRRELISPVLFAVAALARAPDLRIAAEYAVKGERAHGSIDWVYLYQRLAIVVCEVSPLGSNLLALVMPVVDVCRYSRSALVHSSLASSCTTPTAC